MSNDLTFENAMKRFHKHYFETLVRKSGYNRQLSIHNSGLSRGQFQRYSKACGAMTCQELMRSDLAKKELV